MNKEVWKDVPGYEGIYQASTFGNIKSLDRITIDGRRLKGKYKKQTLDNDGYFKTTLHNNNKKKFATHRIILITFVCECPEGMQGCHNNGDPCDNRLDNLRWDTPKNNQADRVKHGTDPKGERNPSAKLTWEQVREIRSKYIPRRYTYRMLGAEYGVKNKQKSTTNYI